MSKLIAIISKPVVYISAGVLVVIIIGWVAFGGSGNGTGTIATVTKDTVTETVLVSGRVQAPQNVDMSLQKTGRVTVVYKKVGDKVVTGDIIVATNAGELHGNYLREQAKLEALTSAARPEEIAIAQSNKENADAALIADQNDLLEKTKAAYIAADNAIRNKVDQFIDNPTTIGAKLNIPVTDVNAVRTLAFRRYELESKLTTLKAVVPSSPSVLTVKPILDEVSLFLTDFASAINSLTSSSAYPQSTISTWKADIATVRSAVITATQDFISARQAVSSSMSDVLVAEQELSIKKAGGSATDIKAQRGTVASIVAQIEDTLIRAPFDGIVTRQDAVLGQTVQSGDAIVALSSTGTYEVEVRIPEISISKVSVGNTAKVTLDAFGPSVVFEAKVITVDLSEKIIDGVPSYKATLQFTKDDPRIKTGMTANVMLTTAVKEGVLTIPERALTLENGVWKVTKVNGSDAVVDVMVGVRGGGKAEIISGLVEGDKVRLGGN